MVDATGKMNGFLLRLSKMEFEVFHMDLIVHQAVD